MIRRGFELKGVSWRHVTSVFFLVVYVVENWKAGSISDGYDNTFKEHKRNQISGEYQFLVSWLVTSSMGNFKKMQLPRLNSRVNELQSM